MTSRDDSHRSEEEDSPLTEDVILQLTSNAEETQTEKQEGDGNEAPAADPLIKDIPTSSEVLRDAKKAVLAHKSHTEPVKNPNKMSSKSDAVEKAGQPDGSEKVELSTVPGRVEEDGVNVAPDGSSVTSPTHLMRTSARRSHTSVPGAVAISYAGRNGATSNEIQDGGIEVEESLQPQDEQAPSASAIAEDAHLVSAVKVEIQEEEIREEIRKEMRQELLHEAVQADVVNKVKNQKWLIGGVTFLLILALAIGLSLGLSSARGNDVDPIRDDQLTPPPSDIDLATWRPPFEGPTFTEVQNRGFIRCGIYNQSYGFSYLNEEKPGSPREGMNIDQCRAVALAALGNSSLYEVMVVTSAERFGALLRKDIDVLTQTATHTMGRDVAEPSAENVGFSFSVPFIYTGLAFGGLPDMVDCADELDTLRGACRQLRVCVGLGTTHELILQELLSATFLVRTSQPTDHVDYLNNGTCNVIAKDSVALPEIRLRMEGYLGDYKIGKRIFSREPLSLVTRDNDSEWTDLVNSVVQLFYTAESLNLTQEQANDKLARGSSSKLEQGKDNVLSIRMLQLVAEFGHYGELYQRTLEDIVPREALNYLFDVTNNHDTQSNKTGLLYYYPWGNLDAVGPGPLPGQTLEKVLGRGHLICGVLPKAGFAQYNETFNTWEGLDIDFCKALNAAIHVGSTDDIEFVDVSRNKNMASSPNYDWLFNSSVDVIAGDRFTLKKDVHTNVTFSTPYYYGTHDNSTVAAYGFTTRPDDTEWSDFVFWIVMATFYAEEQNITQVDPREMPTVNLFGEALKPMFYDCISAVGNYGEIYQRQQPNLPPRGDGPNILNLNLTGPQQFPIPIS